jgi:hypothetical protein
MTESNQPTKFLVTQEEGAVTPPSLVVVSPPVDAAPAVSEGEGEAAVVAAAEKTVNVLESEGTSPALVAAGVVLVLAVVAAVVRKLFL